MASDENTREHPEGLRQGEPPEDARRVDLPEFEIDLSVIFVGSEEFNSPDEESERNSTDPWENPDLLPIDEETRQRLLDLEPMLLQWLNASVRNAEAFALDPITALAQVQPDIDPDFLQTLRQIREESGAQRPWPEGVRVRSWSVSAAEPEKDEGPSAAE
jgi:hypothetical protein